MVFLIFWTEALKAQKTGPCSKGFGEGGLKISMTLSRSLSYLSMMVTASQFVAQF